MVHAHSAAETRYIPYADPFVGKLAGATVRVVEEVGADLIHAHCPEPYGMAARLVSEWTRVPCGLRHAGSDVTLLTRHEW